MSVVPPLAASRPAQPYPGLRPFEAQEWSIFFGRERMIDEIIEHLARERLVVIHGSSGSGKSSLVRAGVMPKLARQFQRHGAPWLTCAMRPSGGPLWNLAAEFARLEGRADDHDRTGTILGIFNRRDATLASVAGAVEGLAGKNLCILVDQFEELFRFEKETSREEAELFVDLIGRAAAAADREPSSGAVDVHVVVTMRSEFLGECAHFDGLAETINRAQYLVPRMDDEALMRAVRRPAQMFNGFVDEPLAQRLIASVRGREDELPLLQHGLMLMWNEATARAKTGERVVLDGAMVEKADGLAELLSGHADAVMASVAPDERRARLVEAIFRELTDVNAEGSAIRRPRNLRDLAAVTGAAPDELRAVIDAFRAPGVSFLTPYAPAPLTENAIIDISHEALIRCWRRIASGQDGWLKREFDDGLAWRSLLVEARAFDKDRRRVLSTAATEDRSKLFAERGESWSVRYGGGWPLVGSLLEASRKAAASARRRKFMGVAALAVLTIAAVVAAAFSDAQRREAVAQRAVAEKQRREAEVEKTRADQHNKLSRMLFNHIMNVNTARPQGKTPDQRLFENMKHVAEEGNSTAALMVGILFYRGLGAQQDYAKAREWFEKAAAAGVARAMLSIGFLYQDGRGAPQDYAKAREWIEKAAAAGDAVAMLGIGYLYRDGQGAPQDYAKAREWFEKAVAAGDAGGMLSIGYLYRDGQGVPQDYAKAREWFEKAAAAGDEDAMRNVGLYYENGRGAPQDYAKAREWYEKAAAAGDAGAMRYIGDLYRDGQGAPQDYAKAREWFEKAAAAGDASASKALSDLQWAPKRNEIEAARSSGQYADALRLQEELAQEIEADEAKTDGKPGARTASELDSLSWHALFAREFPRALSAAERAHSLAPDALWIEINRAHALMFFGRAAEARALYLSHRDEPVPNNADKPWQRVIVEDFAEFRKVGLVNPQMAEIEAALAAGRGTSLSK